MISEDVVKRLALRLPVFSDLFTENYTITSLTLSGTTVTAVTDIDHSFLVGQAVNILGAKTPISVSSFTRTGDVGTIVTDTVHDFTSGPEIMEGNPEVETSGAAEVEFNGSFPLINVQDRNTLIVSMEDSGPTSATGAPQVDNGESYLRQFNGIFEITSVPSTNSFTYEIDNGPLPNPTGDIEARGNARISSAVSLDRIIDAYTSHSQNNLWAFVVLGDVSASKNRKIFSDATDNLQRTNFPRQQLLSQVFIYVVVPSTFEIAGRQSRDLCEELFQPILRSLLYAKFDTGLFITGRFVNPLQFLSHGFTEYNTAYYIHEYAFESVVDLAFEDSIGYDQDVAFRDIELTINSDIGTGQLTANINLDESAT